MNTVTERSRDTIHQITSFINKSAHATLRTNNHAFEQSDNPNSSEHQNSSEFDSVFVFDNNFQKPNETNLKVNILDLTVTLL